MNYILQKPLTVPQWNGTIIPKGLVFEPIDDFYLNKEWNAKYHKDFVLNAPEWFLPEGGLVKDVQYLDEIIMPVFTVHSNANGFKMGDYIITESGKQCYVLNATPEYFRAATVDGGNYKVSPQSKFYCTISLLKEGI